MNGYIIVAISGSMNIKYYVMNTSPLMWTSNISEAKIFEAYKYAKYDIEENFISLSATICSSNISSVWILEYKDNVECGREKFL